MSSMLHAYRYVLLVFRCTVDRLESLHNCRSIAPFDFVFYGRSNLPQQHCADARSIQLSLWMLSAERRPAAQLASLAYAPAHQQYQVDSPNKIIKTAQNNAKLLKKRLGWLDGVSRHNWPLPMAS